MPVSSIPPTIATNKMISLMPYGQYLVCTKKETLKGTRSLQDNIKGMVKNMADMVNL